MEIIIIAAVSKDGYIGKDGSLPWDIPEDLSRFRDLTYGHPVIMGRKTYFSIPEKHRPLKNRANYVLSKTMEIEGVTTAKSMEEALDMIKRKEPGIKDINYNQVFIIGGESVYKKGMEIADTLEITHIKKLVYGDARFPEISADFKIEKSEDYDGFSFTTYKRV
ncbi:MAG: dihydrofolate reductase [Candidatus Altiarchaeota archaeon]|nr:dihydrofolate reductase [Candidatus Altiarchaeota archaeon]